jgi:hypothetical protein
MFRRIIWVACFCIITGTLFSCFEIKEHINIRENGSGSYSFLMDLSQMKPIFAFSRDFQRSMGDTSARAKKAPAMPNPLLQMKAKFDALQPMLESVQGISNYKTVCDTTSYIIGATYSFASMESLNNSIKILRNSTNNGGNTETRHYTFNQKHFEKFNDISKESVTGPTSRNDSLTNDLLKGARYTLTCTFERKIKDVSNPLYFISADGKTLLYTGSLLDIMNQKTNIGNSVVLH